MGTVYEVGCPELHFEALAGSLRCDVVVVGGGFTGLSCGYELARVGVDVVLLEAETLGFGASGRNGGHLCRGLTREVSEASRTVGAEAARSMFALAEEGKALIRARVQEHEIACNMTWGALDLAMHHRHMAELPEVRDNLEALDYRGTRILDKDETCHATGSSRYAGALLDPHSGHFHPLRYLRGLAQAAQAAGLRIFEHTPVTSMTETSEGVQAQSAQGTVQASMMVLGCNGYGRGLSRWLESRVLPVASFQCASEPLEHDEILPSNHACTDMSFVMDYFRKLDGRLLYGTGCAYSGQEPKDIEDYVRRHLERTYPQLKGLRLSHAWSGRIAITANRYIHCGRLGKAVLFAQGYCGHGVVLSNMMGQLLARAVQGEGRGLDLFGQVKHMPLPGGLLRGWLVASAMLMYRLRDRLAWV